MAEEKQTLFCDTCGKETEHVHRDVLDTDYNAMMKPPLWNCESCYRNKRAVRNIGGEPTPILDGRQIFVTGFMATGKSKVGPILAALTGRRYVDTDDLIVDAAGKTIPEIFEQDGEQAFRDLEHEAVRKAAGGEAGVIALGGGAVAYGRNRELMVGAGVTLCLRASVETIFARVSRKRDERPLLAGLSDEACRAKIRAMLEEREPYYAAADVSVTSDERTPPEDTAVEAFNLLKDTTSWKP